MGEPNEEDDAAAAADARVACSCSALFCSRTSRSASASDIIGLKGFHPVSPGSESVRRSRSDSYGCRSRRRWDIQMRGWTLLHSAAGPLGSSSLLLLALWLPSWTSSRRRAG